LQALLHSHDVVARDVYGEEALRVTPPPMVPYLKKLLFGKEKVLKQEGFSKDAVFSMSNNQTSAYMQKNVLINPNFRIIF